MKVGVYSILKNIFLLTKPEIYMMEHVNAGGSEFLLFLIFCFELGTVLLNLSSPQIA
jgi:hypothetical protein